MRPEPFTSLRISTVNRKFAVYVRHCLRYIVLVCFFLCIATGWSQASPPILIGMSAAFTGSSKHLGIELYRGAKAYFEHINRAGGVNGRQLIIRPYDDGYNPIPAIRNTIKLIDQDNVFLLFNYVGTPTVTRVLPLLKVYRDKFVYLFFPFTGAQPHREPPYRQYVFNLRASYHQETEGLVDHLVELGRTRIGIFYQADAYGRSGWDGTRRALEKHDLRIVAEATYPRGLDYSATLKPQVDILKQMNPEAIVSIGAYAACAAFIRDARDAGLDVPIANISFVGSESMLHLLQQSTEATGRDYTSNLITSQVVPSYHDTSLPAVREYRELIDTYNPAPPADFIQPGYQSPRYSFVSLEGYLNAKLLVEMLNKIGSHIVKARLPEAVARIRNYDLGIHAPITFGSDRHQGLSRVYYTTVEAGQFVTLTNWQRWKK